MQGGSIVLVAVALLIVVTLFKSVRIVPQSMKYVVERFGRLRAVLGPGINFTVPFVDRVAHKISILERQLPTAQQDAITTDNVLVKVETIGVLPDDGAGEDGVPDPRCGCGDCDDGGGDRAV